MDEAFNPMYPVSQWLMEQYPQLQAYPKPPLEPVAPTPTGTSLPAGATGTAAAEQAPILGATQDPQQQQQYSSPGHRPLECAQLPGDVLFIPSRWAHMTINAGDTIAFGGQATLFDEER
jgi:hypothetical protein